MSDLKEVKKVLETIREYKTIETDIGHIKLKLEEITNYKEENLLIIEMNKKQRFLSKINNAMNILSEEEREIIQDVHIERKKYYVVQEKIHFSYQRIKQLEKQAALKMKKYIIE